MIELRNVSRRLTLLGAISLCGIGLLAACGKSGSTEVPVTNARPTRSICTIPSLHVAGILSKADENLFSAVIQGDALSVGQSVDGGANVNATTSLKRTPLFAAAFCDRPDVATILIDKGSKLNEKDANGMSALHAATIVGGFDTAKVLIAKGADINIKDGAGRTPLHVAAATDQTPMVQMLLDRGANALARDKNGMTAAALGSENGHKAPGAAIKNWQEKQKTAR